MNLRKDEIAVYVESLLRSGNLDTAMEALGHIGPSVALLEPPQSSKKFSPVMLKLEYRNSESRHFFSTVLTDMTLLMKGDSNRDLVPYFLELFKVVYPAERKKIFSALTEISFSDKEVFDGMQSFAASMATAPEDQKYWEGVEKLIEELLSSIEDVRFAFSLFCAVASLESEVIEKMSENVLLSIHSWDHPSVLQGRLSGEEIDKLKLCINKNQKFLMQFATQIMWRTSLPLTENRLTYFSFEPGDVKIGYFIWLLQLVNQQKWNLTREEFAVLKQSKDRFDSQDLPYKLASRLEKSFEVLEDNYLLEIRGTDPKAMAGDACQAVYLPFQLESNWVSKNSEMFALYHQVVRYSNPSDWKTNEDEFGLAVYARNSKTVEKIKFPANFPSVSSGANGARRKIRPVAILGELNHLLFLIVTPFSDERGWGTENYLFSFEIETRTWHQWTKPESADYLIRTAFSSGEKLVSIAFAEVKASIGLWDKIVFKNDLTPYHIEDSENVEADLPGLEGNPSAEAWTREWIYETVTVLPNPFNGLVELGCSHPIHLRDFGLFDDYSFYPSGHLLVLK